MTGRPLIVVGLGGVMLAALGLAALGQVSEDLAPSSVVAPFPRQPVTSYSPAPIPTIGAPEAWEPEDAPLYVEPAPAPAPQPKPTAQRSTAAPTPRPAPSTAPAPASTPTPTPTPTPNPESTPEPTPTPTPTPDPEPTPTPDAEIIEEVLP